MTFQHGPALNLPAIRSVEVSRGRFYQSPNTKLWYPSVTTVTGHSKAEFFAEWRKKPENAKTMVRASSRGTHLHNIVEKYLLNDPEYATHDDMLAKFMFEKLQPELENIGVIQLQEQAMWSDNLRMAGRLDCLAEYKGKLSIIDFKGSGKPKKEEWVTNYFEQAACYSLMYQEIFGEPVNQIVIMIVSEDGTVQIFKKPVKNYIKSLNETVKSYWKKFDFDALQDSMKGI